MIVPGDHFSDESEDKHGKERLHNTPAMARCGISIAVGMERTSGYGAYSRAGRAASVNKYGCGCRIPRPQTAPSHIQPQIGPEDNAQILALFQILPLSLMNRYEEIKISLQNGRTNAMVFKAVVHKEPEFPRHRRAGPVRAGRRTPICRPRKVPRAQR